MNGELVSGDQVSCSRLGGAMRRHGARMADRRRALARVEEQLQSWEGPAAQALRARLSGQLRVLEAAASDLDRAGALVQRYATDLAEAHEMGRRAEQSAAQAGLEVVDGRVVEPWGPADAAVATRRRAMVPEVQARVDRATAHIGRARGALQRSAAELTASFTSHSAALRAIPASPRSPRS